MTLTQDPYYLQFKQGRFYSTMRWHHLDDLWQVLKQTDGLGWYIYAIGETVPIEPVLADDFFAFIEEINHLLRTEHEEDYCGIVYADNLQKPAFIKIYDPNNLGVTCGYSDNPPLPGWVLSQLKPIDLKGDQVLPGNRKRWWRRLFEK